MGVDPVPIATDCGQYTYAGGFTAALRLFAGSDGARRPDALFCQNDIMAIGAIDALRKRLGLRIPEDVMIIGFDDIPEASRPPYRLTTIRQPLDDLVARTVALLGLGEGEQKQAGPVCHLIPCRLIQRDTLRPQLDDRTAPAVA